MAAVLVESMNALSLDKPTELPELLSIEFKVSGLTSFTLELEAGTAVRDIKKLAEEQCNIAPEHMRFIHMSRELKEADLLDAEMAESGAPIQIIFTAKNMALVGGGCLARFQRWRCASGWWWLLCVCLVFTGGTIYEM